MLDPIVRIACLGNGCCDCSPGGDARRATGTCARRKRVIDAGAFCSARGSANAGTGRSTRLLAVRSRRLAACTEHERHCTEGGAKPRRAESRALSATGSCPHCAIPLEGAHAVVRTGYSQGRSRALWAVPSFNVLSQKALTLATCFRQSVSDSDPGPNGH